VEDGVRPDERAIEVGRDDGDVARKVLGELERQCA
jgi:hypothetical protein